MNVIMHCSKGFMIFFLFFPTEEDMLNWIFKAHKIYEKRYDQLIVAICLTLYMLILLTLNKTLCNLVYNLNGFSRKI